MKKLLFTLISVLVATGLFAVNADLVVPKAGADFVDFVPNGLEDEPIWSQIAPKYITKTFNDDPAPTVDGTYFKMFYTDEYIYLLVNVTDDVFNPLYMNMGEIKQEHIFDKVEVYFDINDVLKDGQGPAYVSGFMAKGHYQMAPGILEENVGSVFMPAGLLYGSLTGQVYVCYDIKTNDQGKYAGYIVEYQFPMYAFINDRSEEMDVESLKALPNGIGFDIIVVDNDKDGYGRKRAVWKNTGPDEPYNNMDNCAVITLGEGGASEKQIHMSETKVYPNPVKNVLTVEGDINKVVISTVTGQQIKVVENQTTIDFTDISSGFYFVETYQDSILKGTHKIIKK